MGSANWGESMFDDCSGSSKKKGGLVGCAPPTADECTRRSGKKCAPSRKYDLNDIHELLNTSLNKQQESLKVQKGIKTVLYGIYWCTMILMSITLFSTFATHFK